ncbi:DegT/DnrJ/EryC1/StrS family aminotransferase [Candidatus Sumerlaeota bacterium]|nr:DegT/DnrJ/EryC1/StrS family aminotransferase [Candidatus Sumerlaeota bacterium]
MKRFIPVAEPVFAGREREYVLDCLDSTWISSNGKYIERFEKTFAEFCGVRHAMACCNGTVALHLALMALGIGRGDEVICPTLTYVATANAIAYCGAKPVLVDSEPRTWNLDPSKIEALVTEKTRAIVVVHLYGHPVDMDPVLALARKYDLRVVEDAAEAHGALYKGRRIGSLGDVATFSFYGNKIITTGEGGMVVTNHADLAARVRLLKGQGMDTARRYWFPVRGYNYRMTNVAAAIGLAQLEKIEWYLERKREVAERYAARLAGVPGIVLQAEESWARHVFWMFSIVLDDSRKVERDEAMRRLAERGVETRPLFYPMHVLPMYLDATPGAFPVADWLAARGMNLPSSARLTESDIDFVCEQLLASIETA